MCPSTLLLCAYLLWKDVYVRAQFQEEGLRASLSWFSQSTMWVLRLKTQVVKLGGRPLKQLPFPNTCSVPERNTWICCPESAKLNGPECVVHRTTAAAAEQLHVPRGQAYWGCMCINRTLLFLSLVPKQCNHFLYFMKYKLPRDHLSIRENMCSLYNACALCYLKYRMWTPIDSGTHVAILEQIPQWHQEDDCSWTLPTNFKNSKDYVVHKIQWEHKHYFSILSTLLKTYLI